VEENEMGILSQQVIQSWFALADDIELPDEYKPPPYHPLYFIAFWKTYRGAF